MSVKEMTRKGEKKKTRAIGQRRKEKITNKAQEKSWSCIGRFRVREETDTAAMTWSLGSDDGSFFFGGGHFLSLFIHNELLRW